MQFKLIYGIGLGIGLLGILMWIALGSSTVAIDITNVTTEDNDLCMKARALETISFDLINGGDEWIDIVNVTNETFIWEGGVARI